MPVLDDVVPSPCIRVCALDEAEVCVGCLRTIGEIKDWGRLTADGRRDVLARVEERRAERAARLPAWFRRPG